MTSKMERKSLSPDVFAMAQNMPKMCLRPGLRPGPVGGAHSAPQRPLAGFVGTLRGGDEEWEGRKGNGREERQWTGGEGRLGEGPLTCVFPVAFFRPVRP